MDASPKTSPGSHIRQERVRRNWRQQDLAEQLGTSVVTIKRWERGSQLPSAFFRVKLCMLFEKSAEELGFYGEEITDTSDVALAVDDSVDTVDSPVAQDIQPVPFFRRRAFLFGTGGTALALAVGGGVWWGITTHWWHRNSVPTLVLPKMTMLVSYPPNPSHTMNDVDWSPDGKFIVCAVGDNTIQVINATTGVLFLTYYGHHGYTNAAKWSPDGRYIASAGADATVQVWEALTGKRVFTYHGHVGSVLYLAWSHDGMQVASTGADATVQVWEALTGEQTCIYRGHHGEVWTVRWSPDDASIVSGGDDGIVHVWNAVSALSSQTFVYEGPHTTTVDEVDWSPDGRHIVSAHASGNAYIWDALVGSLVLTYEGHSAAVRTTRWSLDGKWIASGASDNTVQIWNAVSGKRLLTYSGHSSDVYEVAWSPDGKRLASASKDYTTQICLVQL